MHGSTIVALRTCALMVGALPAAWGWLRTLTRVLVFLDGTDNLSRSASMAEIPGLVLADTVSEVSLGELLIHETAHNLMYVTEAAGPLIELGEERRFKSPLRNDPRPLRGILLAYHALSFICAYYDGLRSASIGREIVDPIDATNLHRLRAEAQAILLEAASSFTAAGAAFFDHTRELASHEFA